MKLSPKMTVEQFDCGYWYHEQLKEFGQKIGINGAKKMRKDELERTIKTFLQCGKLPDLAPLISKRREKDCEQGLTLESPVQSYTNNKQTKLFLHTEAQKLSPLIKLRSGSMYRLNRWREQQILQGNGITYGDLVNQYIRLNESKEPFERVEHGRYINFTADYLKNEPNATRTKAINAWNELKILDIPKNYESWKNYKGKLKK